MSSRSLVVAVVTFVSLGFAATACASANPSGEAAPGAAPGAPTPASARRGGGDVITQDELVGTTAQTVMDAIKQLRPSFLTSRGPTSMNLANPGILVYANGMRLGGVSTLNDIPVQDIKQIQYLNASDATQRFGTGHPSGAILLTRK